MDAFSGWVEQPHDARRREALSPVVRDEQLGAIFRQMRAVVGLNEIALARLLGTDLSVIMDLEAGMGEGLPAWPDLVRIVERYASIAGVDPSPIVMRLMQLSMPTSPPRAMGAPPVPRLPTASFAPPPRDLVDRFQPPRPPVGLPKAGLPTTQRSTQEIPRRPAVAPAASAAATSVAATARIAAHLQSLPSRAPPPPPVATDVDEVVGEAPPPRRRRRWLSRAGAPAILLALLLGVYFAVLELPRAAYATVGYFPVRLQTSVRNVIDLAIHQTSAVRDGLRWIDVGDPRVRKTDRLKSQ